jgi:hypothetical protein
MAHYFVNPFLFPIIREGVRGWVKKINPIFEARRIW